MGVGCWVYGQGSAPEALFQGNLLSKSRVGVQILGWRVLGGGVGGVV